MEHILQGEYIANDYQGVYGKSNQSIIPEHKLETYS